jgi:hypothetical protein
VSVCTVARVTPISRPLSGDLTLQISQLADGLSEDGPLRVAPLLDALVVARTVALIPAASVAGLRGGCPDPLPGLHLDLAAAEVADAFGPAPDVRAPDVAKIRIDDSVCDAAVRLVEQCVRTVQRHLERRSPEHTAEQLLALTRAVLHLDAARNAWRQDPGPS